jgi:uncharacterized protein DUF922
MNCAVRKCVYAIGFGLLVTAQSIPVFAKDSKEARSADAGNGAAAVSESASSEFQWNEHRKLSWEDFRGDVKAASDESAAATHCGIGFKTGGMNTEGKPEIVVYNTFYVNKSWVRPDAKINSILDHEQGHFDLCEIYTRKLRERMNGFDFNTANLKQQLLSIYAEVSSEYESRQQAYEQETVHGTNTNQQKKWQKMITLELM